jgi:hypothetical protein
LTRSPNRPRGFGQPKGSALGGAVYFGATCRVCPWEVRDRSFAIVSLAAEEHATRHGESLLKSESLMVPLGVPLPARLRGIVTVWAEDGLPPGPRPDPIRGLDWKIQDAEGRRH